MNKVILSLLLAVCILGMALIMLNERLGRKSEPAPTPSAEISQPAAPNNGADRPPLPEDGNRNGFAAPPEAARYEPKLPPLPRDDAATSMPAVDPASERVQTPLASPAAPAPQTAEREHPGTSTPPLTAERSATSARAESGTPARAETQKDERPIQPEKAAAPRERSVNRFVVFARDKGATVRLTGNAPLRYKSMNLSNPERVVVDLEGQWQIRAPGVPANHLVSNVRVGKMGDKTRVVIDLKEKPRATRLVLAKDGNTLDVRVDQ